MVENVVCRLSANVMWYRAKSLTHEEASCHGFGLFFRDRELLHQLLVKGFLRLKPIQQKPAKNLENGANTFNRKYKRSLALDFWRLTRMRLNSKNIGLIHLRIQPVFSQNSTKIKISRKSIEIRPKVDSISVEIQPKFNRNSVKIQPKISQNWTENHSKFIQNSIKIQSKFCQNSVKIQQKFSRILTKIHPKFNENQPKISQNTARNTLKYSIGCLLFLKIL